MTYRKDIDGLRAVAVLAVVLYHAGIPGFSGGYVGVDVFFVISGFLITSIILKDIHASRFSVALFYERRIRRIFPALFPVIFCSMVAGGMLFYSDSYRDFGTSMMATTLFTSNILFWKEADYFAASALTKPLLHTWSLSVEEQFYIFFPLLLAAIHRFLKGRYLPVILSLAVLSFLIGVYSTQMFRVAAFYLLPTRAWELLAGSVISLGIIPVPKRMAWKNLESIIGFGLVLSGIFMYDDLTLFPGVAALAPVAGTTMIIHSGIDTGGFLHRIFSFRPMVFIGLISYSLYLWHWPILVFVKYTVFRDLTVGEIALMLLAIFIAASASYLFVEQPFRRGKTLPADRKQLFGLALLIMAATTSAGFFIRYQNGMPYRYPEAELKTDSIIQNMSTDPQWLNFDANIREIEKLDNGGVPAVIGAENTPRVFVLWGDSHAKSLVTALSESARSFGVSGYDIAIGNVIRPLLGMETNGSPTGTEARFNQSVIDFVKAHPEIKVVILAGYWTANRRLSDVSGKYHGAPSTEQLMETGLVRTVDALLALGRQVVLVNDLPILKDDPRRFLYVAFRFNHEPDFSPIAPSFEDYQHTNRYFLTLFDTLAMRPGVKVVRLESMLYDKNQRLMVMRQGASLYVDDDHLSTIGSKYVSPLFDPVFRGIAFPSTTLHTKRTSNLEL
ncbi:MAG: acyltransferase [Chlorobiaceae bacterium]|nr:acyltransferase [Chlorobiaceae bacterium]